MVTIFKEKLRKTDVTEIDTDHGTARKKRIIELLKENPKITEQVICLPLYPELEPENQNAIVNIIVNE